MPVGTKRKRVAANGLSAGERLKRDKLTGPELYSHWGWVSTITDPSQITIEHRRTACGFYDRVGKPICTNKYKDHGGPVPKKTKMATERTKVNLADGEDADDIIIITSDEEGSHLCTKKRCKDNPQCLNYVGQTTLEKDDALQSFLDAANLGPSPLINAREPDLPIGLKNLGATCYANAFIQVWFQDRAFRAGVYRCKPSQEDGQDLEDSPIFQLQTTFAALQDSTQNVFNPVKLVESLQLRASEQQDAQEFSKLFMSHLATEFEKQEVSSLKTLLSDQFEGKQTYGTMCKNCGNRSEQDADFLELEVNLENNGKLEERFKALLQSEELTDDNKYYCTRCDSLQDATRYTKLRKLPPVLHISVLRFVFDVASLSRKKSKQSILFPINLDMSDFMDDRGGDTNGFNLPIKRTYQELDKDGIHSNLLYELRGVLLHKGPSAYHGHYEAQVFDSTTKQFYQFNDETVTPITSLQSKKGPLQGTKADNLSAAANRKRRTYSRKKARVEDSDGELENLSKRPGSSEENYISSKDAYMLIYAQRGGASLETPYEQVPEPPLPARERVAKLNDEHDRACASYLEREKDLTEAFNNMRHRKKSIYSRWELSDHREESAVVSRNALLAWMTKDLEMPKNNDPENPSADGTRSKGRMSGSRERDSLPGPESPRDPLDLLASNAVIDSRRLDNSDIICRHGRLDPRKTSIMKRVSTDAMFAIHAEEDCYFEPKLTTEDICEGCIREMFLDKRYGLDHPRHVSQFEEICEAESDGQGAWISKRWLTDWQQAKPKMHVVGIDDPAPDAPEYTSHVKCVHGQLALVSALRKRISGEACAFLQSLFPTWNPLPEDARTCEACDEELHLSKENKQELKRQIEDEKAKFRSLFFTFVLGTDPEITPGMTQAIIPTDFLRQWRGWLTRPQEKHRPGPIDNSAFFCQHDHLIMDPNVSRDLGASISLVPLSDWEKLQELYGGGPLIRLTGVSQASQQSEPITEVVHDFEVCHACRKERLSNFENATITIKMLGDEEPNPTLECPDGPQGKTPGKSLGHTQENIINEVPADDTKRGRPVRTSNRLKKLPRNARRREVKITKNSTVKDIKVELHEGLNIPTIYQRLFFKGKELTDNGETMASLDVIPNDTFYLREEKERVVDSDAEADTSVRRDEGRAFGGTILSGFSRKAPTPATDEETDLKFSPENICPACTFINPEGLSECSICGSHLNI